MMKLSEIPPPGQEDQLRGRWVKSFLDAHGSVRYVKRNKTLDDATGFEMAVSQSSLI